MNSLSLKNKLILIISVLLAFCTILGIVGYRSANKVAEEYGKIETDNLPSRVALLEGLAHMRSARIYILELTLPHQGDEEMKDMRGKIPREVEKWDNEDKRYIANPPGPGQDEVYKPVKENMELLKKDFEKALELHAKSGGKENDYMSQLRDLVDEQIMKHGKAYREELNKLLKWEDEDVKRNSDAAHDAKTSANKWIIFSWGSAILLGGILGFIILKNIIADQAKTEKLMAEAVRSFNVLESSPNPTMMCTPDGTLLYINKSATESFRKLQQFLPQNVDNLVGKSMDAFHKNPKMVRDLIANPKNLPYKSVIAVGPEKMDLLVTASIDAQGNYLGAAVTWNLITERVELIKDLTTAASDLSTAASNVLSISTNLSAGAEETSAQANTASVASEEVNAGVQTVATNMEEMVSAIKEITKTTNEAAAMTQEAMKITKSTNAIINKLGDSSMDIGNVIKVISSIAQQTNLLALNATIEAARAGEAGKGFAVVANEVKELANQTAKATNEITKKIETIQADSKNAVDAIGEITHAIEKVNGFTSNIAASVEEQAATTNEVTRIVTESAQGVKQISENIQQVSQAASSTGKDAISAQGAAKGVGEISELLKKYVERLKA